MQLSPILQINDIRKTFGTTNVLDGISFEMNEGECICLLGSSGSGKSTLLQIIAGLLKADHGEVKMTGLQVLSNNTFIPPEKRPINMVFQDYALWPHMTIRKNIEYGLKMEKVPETVRNERIASVSKLLHLEELLNRLPSELSGGQQQRVGIARALATEPSILLMDEPLSNLDVKLRTEMRSELAHILRKLSITTIYVTHDMMEAFALADRILVLHEGKIAQLAPPQRMYEEPKTLGVAQLMGYQNRLTGKVIAKNGEEATIQCGEHLIKGIASTDQSNELTVGDDASIMLQLEAIHFDSTSHPPDNYFETKIVQVIYEGSRWRYRLETKDGQHVDGLHTKKWPLDETVCISFSVQQTRIFTS